MKLRFNGKRVLILGGSCDLGIYLAKSLITVDLYPILTYRSQIGLDKINKELKDYEKNYQVAYFDFSNYSSIETLFEQVNNDIDYAIDFAQGDYESFISSAEDEQIAKYFEENVTTRAEILKRISRIMLAKKSGRLVFISSSAANRPNPGQGFYSSAKLASEALYRNLGLELGARGITTVILRPGYVSSGRGKDFIEGHKEEVLSIIPIKRVLIPREVVETIIFLISESASGFNATIVPMDGGLTAGK